MQRTRITSRIKSIFLKGLQHLVLRTIARGVRCGGTIFSNKFNNLNRALRDKCVKAVRAQRKVELPKPARLERI